MRPVEVSEHELINGPADSRLMPPLEYKIEHRMVVHAHNILFGNIAEYEFGPRIKLDQVKANRHINAIKAAKIKPELKQEAIARLLTLWYTTISKRPTNGE